MIEELTLGDSQVRLPDGRTLAYAEYGEAAGRPVLFCHGTPGSRVQDPRALRAGTAHSRIIAVARPGYGRSDFHTGWGMLDWADDVAALADALGLARFAVIGVSGGGPYAAACAYRWPARVSALGLLSSVAPQTVDRAGAAQLAADDTGLEARTVAARTLAWPEYWAWRKEVEHSVPPNGEQVELEWVAGLPARVAPETRECLRRTIKEAHRQGMEGLGYDGWLLRRPWGFRLEEIAVPAYVWQGEQDETVPLRDAQYLAQVIPGCRAVYFPEEDHLIPPHYWEEILTTLVADLNAGEGAQ
jgi:pimeloyl-ACP methyl ester carboxylesterase